MTDAPPLLTDEMDARVERLLKDWRATGRAPGGAAQDFARMARELGVGIVDPTRHRSWIDERVYEGALLRCREATASAEAAERALAEFQGMNGEGR
ncbi:hypothetical protein [Reyranella sp.]|uniref:hypothetical protein n=1 Tax=Reyranella sp. TaxID=1929291 RepID=UPI003C7AA202